MILIENIKTLKKKYPGVWEKVKVVEDSPLLQNDIRFIESKNGLPNLQVGEIYLHSRYNPEHEAKRAMGAYSDIENYKHIFFYGVGMGYYIEQFSKLYPDVSFSIYEPNISVFYQYILNKPLKNLPLKRLDNIYVGNNQEELDKISQHLITMLTKGEVLFVTLPSYERIFKDEYKRFSQQIRDSLVNKRWNITAEASFEKRWTINSMINFKKTIQTPNVLHDVDKEVFKGKPALLVAAGPSLEEEIENIRYIKENGLAYIFSVGAAINALIEHDVYPDAACTYDPTYGNQWVFDKVVERNINTIPLIYGTSVGFETIQKYPGPLLHMWMSQDTVAPFYLKYREQNKRPEIFDAPSVAVVTLQLMQQLGIKQIYLVGQNFAYKDDLIYSKSILYGNYKTNTIPENIREKLFMTEDVYGGQVSTDERLTQMRKQMEFYLQLFSDTEVINTTKGGAKIAGTVFMTLEEVIQIRLQERIVDHDWYNVKENGYDREFFTAQCKVMEEQLQRLLKVNEQLIKTLQEMQRMIDNGNESKIAKLFLKFDQSFKEFNNNVFFETFLKPMNRVLYDLALHQVEEIRFESIMSKKAEKLIQQFGKLILSCNKDLEMIYPLFKDIQKLGLGENES